MMLSTDLLGLAFGIVYLMPIIGGAILGAVAGYYLATIQDNAKAD